MSANWLADLAPEHAPAPPSWWPPAPGWWVATGLCLVLLAAWFAWRRFARHTGYRRVQRAALDELERIRSQEELGSAAAIQRLLRRYALTIFGPDRMAPLTGEAWVDFVAEHGGEGLAGDVGRSLLGAAFGNPAAPAARESWLAAAEAFIRQAPRHARRGRGTRLLSRRGSQLRGRDTQLRGRDTQLRAERRA